MTRKRKERKEVAETLIPDSRNSDISRENDDEEGEVGEESVKGFFACYLLCSLSPRFKGHSYIGFTVNPRRRIRQHNGEITSGAWRTKRKRPWEMALCVYGFPTNVSALQFEWAWQHPTVSLCVRKAAASMKSLSGIANKIKLVYLMLTLAPWQSLKLTVNFFSTKYAKHSVGCPSLPKQMKVEVCPIDELPCYIEGGQLLDENNDDEDDQFEGDENDNGHPDTSLNISKTAHDQLRGNVDDGKIQLVEPPLTQRQQEHKLPFYLVDSPVRIPVSSTDRLGNSVQTIEEDNSFRFSEESSDDFMRAAKCRLVTSTEAKLDQLPSSRNCNFSSEFGFRQADECRNSLELIEDGYKLGQPMKQKFATTVVTNEESTRSLLFSSEFGSRQQDDPFILTEEDHRVTFNLVDSPPSSSTTSLADKVTTVEDKTPRRLFQGSTSKRRRATEQQVTSLLKADDEQLQSTNSLYSPGVEVINLLTPSSECIIPSYRGTKRASLVRHEIVDLTNSPGSIQS